jgi:hypothetical protein
MMTAWNTDSGVAIHAEPVGKAWIEMGHKDIHLPQRRLSRRAH